MGLFQLLVLLSIQIIASKNNFTKTGYFPVPVCPNNTHEWQASSRQLNCTDTHIYHCAPYYDLSQLYEFCYQRPLLEVKKGHCIGIAESGILNQLNCEYFAHGCPREDYNSSQLYNYPNCLSILNGCYTEDCVCKCQSARKEIDTKTSKSDIATVPNFLNISGQRTEPASCENQYLIAFVIICLICLIASVALNVVQYRKQSGQGCTCYTSTSSDEGLGLLNGHNHETQLQQRHTSGTQTTSCDEQGQNHETQLQQRNTSGTQTTSCDEQENETCTSTEETRPLEPNAKEIDRTPVSDRQQSSRFEPDDIFRMTLVDFTIEDEQLFDLLKRQCLHGVYSEFEYLMRTRVKNNKKEYIFEQRDKNGCILLHYAAQGGNTIILDDILEILEKKCPNILEEKCIRGQCALHFAIKHEQKNMIDHLIKLRLHSDKKNQNAESTATHQEGEFDTVRGEFSPVHLAAWFGDTQLLTTLMKNGFEINRKTRNGLNILDIACMKQLCGESETEFQFCEHLIINNLLKPNDLSKTDMSGWNIAHYASLSNFKLFKYIASHDEVCELVMVKTKASKTCLHIACEFGKTEIVGFIAGHFTLKKLIPEKDKLGWNALHFAAKGGELKILECLLKIEGMEIDSKTDDGKTLLHIACIHKKTEICKFLIKQFGKNKDKYKELLNIKTTNNKLTAAHYLAVEKKEDGSEREILKMLINTKQVDFSAINASGLTVLEFAVNHLNKEMIECILSATYREVFQINAKILEKCKKYANDDSIKQILERTISEINSLNT